MGEDNMNPAGLGGKLYFCRKEDFEKDPNCPKQEVELEPHVGDIAYAEWYKPQEGDGERSDKGGFSLTATATFEATPEQQKLFRRLAQGQGRLPRRRKKQVMNRVLRYEDRCRAIARFMVNSHGGLMDPLGVVIRVMFYDKECGYSLVINEAEYHIARLCLKRIEKKYRKYIESL